MKRPWFVPSASSLVSASLLYGVLVGLSVVAAAVVPSLLELMRTSPRLAMLGFLGLTLSPAFAIVVAHRLGHRALDAFDREPGEGAEATRGRLRATSWWAGTYGWLVLYGTSVLTTWVLLVIDPPEPEPDTLWSSAASLLVAPSRTMSPSVAIWIAIAALLYEAERRQRRRRRRPSDREE